jgi:hypothetical protein
MEKVEIDIPELSGLANSILRIEMLKTLLKPAKLTNNQKENILNRYIQKEWPNESLRKPAASATFRQRDSRGANAQNQSQDQRENDKAWESQNGF